MTRRAVGPLLLLSLAVSGCGILSPRVCTQELGWSVEPTSAVLRVGERFAARVDAFTCGGKQDLPVDIVWSTSDADVATVDEESGRVTAVAVGSAVVTGEDRGRYGVGPVEIPVEVVP